jgi:hypothetical protein
MPLSHQHIFLMPDHPIWEEATADHLIIHGYHPGTIVDGVACDA